MFPVRIARPFLNAVAWICWLNWEGTITKKVELKNETLDVIINCGTEKQPMECPHHVKDPRKVTIKIDDKKIENLSLKELQTHLEDARKNGYRLTGMKDGDVLTEIHIHKK